jgi:hypothetical protein
MQARDASAAEPALLATDEVSWYPWSTDLPSPMMMIIVIAGMRVRRRRVVQYSGYELSELLPPTRASARVALSPLAELV